MEFFRLFRNKRRIDIAEDDFSSSVSRMQQRGRIPDQSGSLGLLFSYGRLAKKLTVDELSQKTGVEREKIVDFELGTLSLSEATSVAEALKTRLRVDEKAYKKTLLSSAQKQ